MGLGLRGGMGRRSGSFRRNHIKKGPVLKPSPFSLIPSWLSPELVVQPDQEQVLLEIVGALPRGFIVEAG